MIQVFQCVSCLLPHMMYSATLHLVIKFVQMSTIIICSTHLSWQAGLRGLGRLFNLHCIYYFVKPKLTLAWPDVCPTLVMILQPPYLPLPNVVGLLPMHVSLHSHSCVRFIVLNSQVFWYVSGFNTNIWIWRWGGVPTHISTNTNYQKKKLLK